MSLRAKTLVIVGATLLALLLSFQAVASVVLRRSVAQAEAQEVRQVVNGVRGAIDLTVSSFNTRFTDWSAWDDACRFVRDGNPEFIRSNLVDYSLKNLH